MVASGPVITLLPGLGFDTRSRPAPARALLEAGAAVALGSNFNRSDSPLLNMQTVVSLACRELGMTPAEALVAATINGAYALGRGATAGSIEHGKPADLILLNVSDYRELGVPFRHEPGASHHEARRVYLPGRRCGAARGRTSAPRLVGPAHLPVAAEFEA